MTLIKRTIPKASDLPYFKTTSNVPSRKVQQFAHRSTLQIYFMWFNSLEAFVDLRGCGFVCDSQLSLTVCQLSRMKMHSSFGKWKIQQDTQ